MDALSVKFEYERECYELGEFNYLPDFWVPIIGAHIEIKPEPPTNDEECKATRLAEFTGKPVYIFVGSPAIPDWCSDDNAYAYFPSGCVDVQYYWCECPKCHQIGVEFNGRSDRIACKCVKGGDKGYNHDSIRLRQAYAKATGYRFEPGAINP